MNTLYEGFKQKLTILNDFIFVWFNWQIKYLMVDTQNRFDSRKFLIETGTIKEMQLENSKDIVEISADEIKDGTVFDEFQFKHSWSTCVFLVNS
jgi:hypothetical protein